MFFSLTAAKIVPVFSKRNGMDKVFEYNILIIC